ncbi:TetR/AcrR family transcriptional regulator [Pseudonocardia spinosispora]|uniref:TetR/AcrR family transcriptional regulator n=1 Tax=Pseudonocardia spinosispora TaxID=103441 RepID=UPI00048BB3A8|nr:TetR/AcrR family transcriptional regulator [Pseudonocardia spinosispora]
MNAEPAGVRRPHTGRRRNEAARRSILDAAAELLADPAVTTITIDEIAKAAGVGRQTIYRWWPSKGAVLFEAMVERAEQMAPVRASGSRLEEIEGFLAATFASAGEARAASVLRAGVAEALRDPEATSVMKEFTAHRRAILVRLLTDARDAGELPEHCAVDLIADQAYGLLWYRILIRDAPLSAEIGRELANALISQAKMS